MKRIKPPARTIERLASRRLEVESRLADLRRALDREIGWAPQAKTWVLPLVAFAAGVAVAGLLAVRRRRSGL